LKTPAPGLADLGAAGDLGALAHYADPAYYTKTYRNRRQDVAYYVELARRVGGPVLEYGVGNGRIALELARAGVSVVGVDLSVPMLRDLEARLQKEPGAVQKRVQLVRADMRRRSLRRRFPLVIAPFNVVLHLYTRQDVEAFFARVQSHLTPRGRFVFDFSVPQLELARDPSKRYGAPRIRHPTTGELTRYTERFEYDPIRQLLLIWMEFVPVDNPRGGWVVPLTHRQFFPQEMAALLHYAGFRRLHFTGDFMDAEPDEDTDSIVVEARPPLAGKRPTT
jgi:SAM-dependent methyltransferase